MSHVRLAELGLHFPEFSSLQASDFGLATENICRRPRRWVWTPSHSVMLWRQWGKTLMLLPRFVTDLRVCLCGLGQQQHLPFWPLAVPGQMYMLLCGKPFRSPVWLSMERWGWDKDHTFLLVPIWPYPLLCHVHLSLPCWGQDQHTECLTNSHSYLKSNSYFLKFLILFYLSWFEGSFWNLLLGATVSSSVKWE